MKHVITVRNIKEHIHDKMYLYKDDSMHNYNTVYFGLSDNIPDNLLDKEVLSIGATENGIVDIKIR